jgi:hypothetical protein
MYIVGWSKNYTEATTRYIQYTGTNSYGLLGEYNLSGNQAWWCLPSAWPSSSTTHIGLASVADPQICFIHFFCRSRLLFPVGFYDNMYRAKKLRSTRVRWLNHLSLWLLMVSPRPFMFIFFLIASSVNLYCPVFLTLSYKSHLGYLISAFIFPVSAQFSLP